MNEYLTLLLLCVTGISTQDVHLIPAHEICSNVTEDHDILLPDPHDCSIYYRCENGAAVPESCPPGLEWCQILTKCTLPAIANCTIGRRPVTYPPSSTGHTPKTTPGICPLEGAKLPNEVDCKSYFTCKNGEIVSEQCPDDELYSCWDQTCESAATATCINNITIGQTCPNSEILLPDENDCQKYYKCENGKVELKVCAEGELYSKWSETCKSANLVTCDSNTTTPTTSTPTSSSTTETASSTNTPSTKTTKTPTPTPTCPFEGAKLPNEVDCKSYFICKNGEIVSEQCPDDELYSCWDQTCKSAATATCINNITIGQTCPNSEILLPDENDCQKYYKCENGKVELKVCAGGELYSKWSEKCKSANLVTCENISTSTSTRSTTTETTHTISTISTESPPPSNSPTGTTSTHTSGTTPTSTPSTISTRSPEITPTNNPPTGSTSTPTISTRTTETTPKPSPTGTTNTPGKTPTNNSPTGTTSTPTISTRSTETTPKPSPTGTTNTPGKTPTNNSPTGTTSTPTISTRTTETTPKPSPTGTTNTPGKTPTNNSPTGTTSTPTISTRTTETTPKPSPTGTTNTPGKTSTNNSPTGTTSTPTISTRSTETTPKPSPTGTTSTPGKTPTNNSPTGTRSTPTISTRSTETTLKPPSPFCPRDGLRLPTFDDCHAYFLCENRQPVKITCYPPEFNYDCRSKQCENTTHCCASNPPSSHPTSLTPTTTTVAPSESSNNCPIEGARLPDPVNCTSYYVCRNNLPVSEHCPDGKEYSCWDQTCEIPTVAKCITEGIHVGEPCSNSNEKLPDIDNCNSYYQCINAKVELVQCPPNTKYNSWFQKCVKNDLAHCEEKTTPTSTSRNTTVTHPTTPSTCPFEGAKLPNEVDCKSYFVCKNGEIVSEQCSDGELYSCWDQTCESETTATCINGPDLVGHNCSTIGLMLPDVTDCKSYYQCVDGKVEKEVCADEKVYSKWYKNCADNVTCEIYSTNTPTHTTHTKTTHTSISPTPTGITPSPTEDICPKENATIPNPLNCTTYFRCIHEIPTLESCPAGLEYSCWDQTCEKSADCISDTLQENKTCSIENLRLPAPNCDSYYECTDGKVILKHCPLGEKFNDRFQKCYEPDLAHCQEYTTPTSTSKGTTQTPTSTTNSTHGGCPFEGAKLPNEVDCKSYFICKNGEIVSEQCPDGELYSCWDQTCESETTATCINGPDLVGHNCSTIGLMLPDVTDCKSYYQCVDGKVEKEVCGDGKVYSKWYNNCADNVTCEIYSTNTPTHTTHTKTTHTSISPTPTGITPSPTEDICPKEDATIPNPLNCTTYFRCIHEIPTLESCPAGLEYSCWNQICEKSADCISDVLQENKTCSIENLRLPAPNCDSYYECTDGKVVLKHCPPGEKFNDRFQKCYEPDLAHCQEYTTPTSTSKGTTQTPTSTTNSTHGGCPSEGAKLPNEVDCKSYFICKNGEIVSEQCPDDELYSCWDQTCESETTATCINGPDLGGHNCSTIGLMLPDVTDCKSYYKCVDGKVEKEVCSDGKIYSKWYKNCVDNGTCEIYSTNTPTHTTHTKTSPTSISPTPTNETPLPPGHCPYEGAKLPNEDDCKSYFTCKNKEIVSEQCPDGELYSCWDQKCESEITATCITSNVSIGQSCSSSEISLPDKNDCQKYYKCENGKVELKVCAEGELYSKWFQMCKSAHLVTCDNETSTQTVTKPTSNSTASRNPLCPKDGLRLPSFNDCHAYMLCENGQPVKVQCYPPEYNYNCKSKQCEDITHCCAAITPPSSPTNPTPTTTTVAPSEGTNNCPIEGARLPDPVNCTSYYVCRNNVPVSEHCPDGKEYSCWDQTCETPTVAKCITEGIHVDEPCSNNNEKLPDTENCDSYYQCKNAKVELVQCPPNKKYNSWFQKCVDDNLAHCEGNTTSTSNSTITTNPTPIQHGICPFDGAKLPNEDDCKSYYICKYNEIVQEQCPDGELYSCWDQKCESEKTATCITSNITPGQKCSNSGKSLPDKDDCQKYYKCEKGKVELKTCAKGKLYSDWQNSCVSAKQVICNNKPTPAPSQTYDICPIENATLPNPIDCSSFYRCVNNTPVLEKCTEGLEYSCWDQKCEASADCISVGSQENKNCSVEGLRLPEEDCSNYYECEKGKVVLKHCPSGLEFNDRYQKCLEPSLSHCQNYSTSTPPSHTTPHNTSITPNPNSDICPNDGALLPNPLNCSTYYKCINGTPTLELCADGFEYDCWDETCKPAAEANCIANDQAGKKCKRNYHRTQKPDDCHAYYECVNGFVQTKRCSFNWYYNKWFHICVPFEILSHCKKTSTITPSPTPTTATIAPSLKDQCPVNGAVIPNPEDCSSYLVCEKNKGKSRKCPSGQEYSSWDQECKPANSAQCINDGSQLGNNCSRDGVKLQNIENCGSYYECVNGKVEKIYCFIGFQYNRWYQKCLILPYAHCKLYSVHKSKTTKPPKKTPFPWII